MRNEQIALKTLFKEEAANKKLKTFLPDVINASPSTFDADSLDSEFFTDNFENLNVNQQKAVIGALNSDDLFLKKSRSARDREDNSHYRNYPVFNQSRRKSFGICANPFGCR